MLAQVAKSTTKLLLVSLQNICYVSVPSVFSHQTAIGPGYIISWHDTLLFADLNLGSVKFRHFVGLDITRHGLVMSKIKCICWPMEIEGPSLNP